MTGTPDGTSLIVVADLKLSRRTGTASLHTALSRLGYRVYHSSELVKNGKRDMDLLHEALLLKNDETKKGPYGPQEFDRLWGKYDAVGDLPGFAFVNELVSYYPQAQFILTDRNVDAWARAMRATTFAHAMSWPLFFQSLYDGQHARPLRRLMRTWLRMFCRLDFGNGAREAYIDHVQHCLKVVPKERLLILRFEEDSEWHDLCEFLGKEMPDTQYPVVGESARVVNAELHLWSPTSRVVFGKLYAFAVGVVLAAGSWWLVMMR